MAIIPLNYTAPAYTTTNVLYGVGILFTAPPGTAVPGDAYLGYGTSWTGLGWSYIGGTLDGVTLTFAPTTQNILIEEQPTPVGGAVSTADLTGTRRLGGMAGADRQEPVRLRGSAGRPPGRLGRAGADRVPQGRAAAGLPAHSECNLPVHFHHGDGSFGTAYPLV